MPETVNAVQVKHMMDSGVGIVPLDVRSSLSYGSKHLPGAVNAPLEPREEFRKRVEALLPDKETPIITYASNANSALSPLAVEELQELGYRRVWDFPSGLKGWHESGYHFDHGT